MTPTRINISWPAVPGVTKYTIKSGTTSVQSVLPTVHGLLVSNNATVAITAIVPPPAPPSPPIQARWFADSSPWNMPVGANPKIHPQNASIMSQLVKVVGGVFTDGQMSDGAESIPVYLATASTPVVTVKLGRPYNGTSSVQIPYEQGQQPAAGDGHFTAYRPDTGWYCEFQGFTINPDGTLSAYAYAEGNMRSGLGVPTATDNISVLPTPGGLMLRAELLSGKINHAIRWAMPCGSKAVVPPAIYSDGGSSGFVAAGQRFWLPPGSDLSSCGGDAFLLMQCDAYSTYGAYNGDENNGGAISAFAESEVEGFTYPFELTSLPLPVLAQMQVLT